MTKSEWLEQADAYEAKAESTEDESLKELYSSKAQASREAAVYGTEE